MNDQRLTEIETRYSYLERLVEDLSRVMHEQQRTIDSISARVQRLETFIAEAVEQNGAELPHDKPPHY